MVAKTDQIQISKYNLESILNCVICSEYMSEPTTMKCGHSFCRQCILKWFCQYKHSYCPVCRQKVSKHMPYVNISLKQLIETVNLNKRLKYKSQEIIIKNSVRKRERGGLGNILEILRKSDLSLAHTDSTLSTLSILTSSFHFVFSFFAICLVLLIKLFKI